MKKKLTLKKLIFEQQVLAILLFSFMVILLWVASSIYFSYTKSTLTQEDATSIIPLTPTIDTKLIDRMEIKKWWSNQELSGFALSVEKPTVVGSTPTPQKLPTPTPLVATQSATQAASPSATPVEGTPIPSL